MDALAAINDRSSIRCFTDQPVGRETIEQLLDCARKAPSASNQQPWANGRYKKASWRLCCARPAMSLARCLCSHMPSWRLGSAAAAAR